MTAVKTSDVDLAQCAREPIHIPGSIQPHGVFLALDGPELTVARASANIDELCGVDALQLLGTPLQRIPGIGSAELARDVSRSSHVREPVPIRTITVADQTWRAVVHRSGALVLLELERTAQNRELSFPDLQGLVWSFIAQLGQTGPVPDLTRFAAAEIRRITGFDRTLVYRFDEDWNGTVVAEDRNDRLPSYLDLRFPASDIPAQARELYRINRIRIIPDAGYTPVPILPADAPPLDLSYSVLRSVSPVHVEYMRNMGTASSMSISLMQEGQLWGLISCHSAEPKHVGFELRTACDLIGQVFSLQLTSREHSERYEARIKRKEIHAQLLAAMARENHFSDGLVTEAGRLMRLTEASGAAVLFGQDCALIGATPSEPQIRALATWVSQQRPADIWHSACLPEVYPPASAFADKATGVVAASISELHGSYLFWFRPELIRTVTWGGDPRKPVEEGVRIHPRKSFEQWKEIVRGQSAQWTASDLEAAADLRSSIVSIVLRKAEELAELSEELERSNKELEAFSYSVSHDLRAPFRHIVGYAELLSEMEADKLTDTGKRYIRTIIESAQFAGTLVDNLLTFSQIARTAMTTVPVDMNQLVGDVRKRLQPDTATREIEWVVHPLPPVVADPSLLRLAVYNLVANAVKYTRGKSPARIEIRATRNRDEVVFAIADNGAGFDMKYSDKLFGVFQRLHRMEDFEGTGIGLANVRRIIARHGGRTWAEGSPGVGATFYFSLPEDPEGA